MNLEQANVALKTLSVSSNKRDFQVIQYLPGDFRVVAYDTNVKRWQVFDPGTQIWNSLQTRLDKLKHFIVRKVLRRRRKLGLCAKCKTAQAIGTLNMILGGKGVTQHVETDLCAGCAESTVKDLYATQIVELEKLIADTKNKLVS